MGEGAHSSCDSVASSPGSGLGSLQPVFVSSIGPSFAAVLLLVVGRAEGLLSYMERPAVS